MGILDQPINLGSLEDYLTAPVLTGVGVGVLTSYLILKKPSPWEMMGLGFLGGLGGYYISGVDFTSSTVPLTAPTPRALPNTSSAGSTPGPKLPTFDFKGFFENLGNDIQQVFTPTAPAPSPAPSPAPASGGTSVAPNTSLMTPQIAYSLVQAGQYSRVKVGKLSRYYTWADFMVSASITDANRKTIPLDKYLMAAKLGLALDKLCDATGGKKIAVNSWLRIQAKSSNHTTGGAADLGGSLTYNYIKGTLYPTARTIADFKGVGYPTVSTHRSLHLDILANHGCPAGQQFDFVDNGDGNYTGACKPVNRPAAAKPPAPPPAPKPAPAPKPPLVLLPLPVLPPLYSPPPETSVSGVILPDNNI